MRPVALQKGFVFFEERPNGGILQRFQVENAMRVPGVLPIEGRCPALALAQDRAAAFSLLSAPAPGSHCRMLRKPAS